MWLLRAKAAKAPAELLLSVNPLIVTMIRAPPRFAAMLAKLVNNAPPLPISGSYVYWQSVPAKASLLAFNSLNQLDTVSPLDQLNASPVVPPGKRSQPGESRLAYCCKFVSPYSSPPVIKSAVKPAKPRLSGVALVVLNDTTRFVLSWARLCGASQWPADKINNT